MKGEIAGSNSEKGQEGENPWDSLKDVEFNALGEESSIAEIYNTENEQLRKEAIDAWRTILNSEDRKTSEKALKTIFKSEHFRFTDEEPESQDSGQSSIQQSYRPRLRIMDINKPETADVAFYDIVPAVRLYNGEAGTLYIRTRDESIGFIPDGGFPETTPDTPDTPEDPEKPNHEWVDLGLSVKWATCNVGADSPEEYGNYYAWGETEPKDYYSDETITFGLNISELESRGYIDNEGNLTSSYDAATANWGKEWRMPTEDEVKELIEKGIWTWQYLNGVKGYKVTGPSGNSIFLPPAGECYWGNKELVGKYGNYWSSTASEYKNIYGQVLYEGVTLSFYDEDYFRGSDFRYYGKSVRPVSAE